MLPGFLLVCSMALQQLGAAPFPAEVGSEVTVRATRLEPQPGTGEAGKASSRTVPIVALAVDVELPDHTRRALGATDANGELRFVPEQPGTYVFAAMVDGVRVLAPHRVVPVGPRWWPALVCVPLGLALLWRHLRPRR